MQVQILPRVWMLCCVFNDACFGEWHANRVGAQMSCVGKPVRAAGEVGEGKGADPNGGWGARAGQRRRRRPPEFEFDMSKLIRDNTRYDEVSGMMRFTCF